ncbi:MAG: hypothetical protein HYX34_09200 [Actinobacteria bacterium]|nr:hypothetical protein [Actinomycetota bacterium]
MESGTCDSCGDERDDLVHVHRHYVTPASWDAAGRVDVDADVERWCLPCRSHYPHEVLGDGAGEQRA